MKTECTENRCQFQPFGRKEIVADFNGGTITSNGGGLLLRDIEKRTDILGRFANCFTDHRHQVMRISDDKMQGQASCH